MPGNCLRYQSNPTYVKFANAVVRLESFPWRVQVPGCVGVRMSVSVRNCRELCWRRFFVLRRRRQPWACLGVRVDSHGTGGPRLHQKRRSPGVVYPISGSRPDKERAVMRSGSASTSCGLGNSQRIHVHASILGNLQTQFPSIWYNSSD